MAKKNKARRTSKKVTIKRGSASKGKMKAARNGCCPIISTHCTPTFKYKTETVVGDDTAYDKKVKVPTGMKCSVKLGAVSKGKNLSVEDKNKKVEELSKQLAEKRCVAIVETEKDRAAKRISAQEARMWAKHQKSK